MFSCKKGIRQMSKLLFKAKLEDTDLHRKKKKKRRRKRREKGGMR